MATEKAVMAVIRASRPRFRSAHDKVSFAIHASFLVAGYSLIATGKAAFADKPPTDGEEVGIEGWNELEDCYGFVYKKDESGVKKTVLVKCLVIEDILAVEVVNLEGQQKQPFNLHLKVKEYLKDTGEGPKDYGEMYTKLGGLVEAINSEILEKLEPKVEMPSSSRSGQGTARNTTSEPAVGTSVPEPEARGIFVPPVPLYDGSDLYPGPGASVFPRRPPGPGGDMLVGPNDPRWFGSGERPGSFPGGIPGVPPGARFDPYGPPGVPGFEPGRFVRDPRRPGGQPHPDLQHFPNPDQDYI